MTTTFDLNIFPVTPERWPDLEALFGPKGACAGCWCMYWRVTRKVYNAQQGDGNRQAIRAIIESGEIPGLLAYNGSETIGWISIEPRPAFPVLENSRILAPVDDQPVWSVVCFFVNRRYRRQGVTVGLLKAAVEYAASHGARIIEGYPVIPKHEKAPPVFIYTGTASAFQQAGFVEVARRSETRPIMRKYVDR